MPTHSDMSSLLCWSFTSSYCVPTELFGPQPYPTHICPVYPFVSLAHLSYVPCCLILTSVLSTSLPHSHICPIYLAASFLCPVLITFSHPHLFKSVPFSFNLISCNPVSCNLVSCNSVSCNKVSYNPISSPRGESHSGTRTPDHRLPHLQTLTYYADSLIHVSNLACFHIHILF